MCGVVVAVRADGFEIDDGTAVARCVVAYPALAALSRRIAVGHFAEVLGRVEAAPTVHVLCATVHDDPMVEVLRILEQAELYQKWAAAARGDHGGGIL